MSVCGGRITNLKDVKQDPVLESRRSDGWLSASEAEKSVLSMTIVDRAIQGCFRKPRSNWLSDSRGRCAAAHFIAGQESHLGHERLPRDLHHNLDRARRRPCPFGVVCGLQRSIAQRR